MRERPEMTADFFQAQEDGRARSRRFFAAFALSAVVGLVILYLAVAAVFVFCGFVMDRRAPSWADLSRLSAEDLAEALRLSFKTGELRLAFTFRLSAGELTEALRRGFSAADLTAAIRGRLPAAEAAGMVRKPFSAGDLAETVRFGLGAPPGEPMRGRGVLADVLKSGLSPRAALKRRDRLAEELAAALKKIAASPDLGIIKNGEARAMEAFFFVSPLRRFALLRAHPPLAARIKPLEEIKSAYGGAGGDA